MPYQPHEYYSICFDNQADPPEEEEQEEAPPQDPDPNTPSHSDSEEEVTFGTPSGPDTTEGDKPKGAEATATDPPKETTTPTPTGPTSEGATGGEPSTTPKETGTKPKVPILAPTGPTSKEDKDKEPLEPILEGEGEEGREEDPPPAPMAAIDAAALEAAVIAASKGTCKSLLEDLTTEIRKNTEKATGIGAREIKPPIFRGTKGERPESHLLRTEDWFESKGIAAGDRVKEFKHTLDHFAREWYRSSPTTKDWDEYKTEFSKYYSTQGRSVKNLHETWKQFTFDPQTGDIEEFIRDVRETGTQLKYNNEAILNQIKSCMPDNMDGPLYGKDKLDDVVTMLKEIYANKPTKSQATTSTSNPSASPFSVMQNPSIDEKLDRLAQCLYEMEMKDKPKKPYKPFVTGPRKRGRGGGSTRGRGKPFHNPNRRFEFSGRGKMNFGYPPRGGSKPRGRGGKKFDRSPNTRKPRVASKTRDKDQDRCHHCKQFGHWARECPENTRAREEKLDAYQDYAAMTHDPMTMPHEANPHRYASAMALPTPYTDAYNALHSDSPLSGLNL